ncbi:hypothetical protein P692DRAFT_201842237 [Suillus brevipes Sb2]|nr:hypothetical protein P692DRAFT_201842237 [Suillus brevipes Sb2]
MSLINSIFVERLSKEWVSPIYAFFEPFPIIGHENGRRYYEFRCVAKGCGKRIRRFLDKKDAKSTSNMRKHARTCWGEEVVKAADDAKSCDVARESIVNGILTNGSITASFERKGKGKITYSHRQHTKTETKAEIVRWTGRPEYYIPSPSTVSRDVKLVFVRTRKRIAKMLQDYDGRLNFATDAWTSPNHKAFVAISVHLEHDGIPIAMVLDIVEVAVVNFESLTWMRLLMRHSPILVPSLQQCLQMFCGNMEYWRRC